MKAERENPLLLDFFQRADPAQTARLLLDYDGTLAPFQQDRFQAHPYPGVIPILERIVRSGKTQVSIITGRPTEEILGFLRPLQEVEVWGAHGMEHLSATGVYRRVDIDSEVLLILEQAREWLHQSGLLSFAEIKPGGIAVHLRGLSGTESAEILNRIQQGWNRFDAVSAVKLLQFDGGIELRTTHPNKGDAVDAILADVPSRAPVAFLGDDLTDEDAFRALGQRGLSILVRPEYRETSATVWLRPPQELIAFLQAWSERFA